MIKSIDLDKFIVCLSMFSILYTIFEDETNCLTNN